MRGGDPARCASLALCSRGAQRSRRRRRARWETACNARSHHLCAACIQSSAHASASAWVTLQPPARWRSCAGSIASHSQCRADGHTASMHMRASASRKSRCQICSASIHTRCQCRCVRSASARTPGSRMDDAERAVLGLVRAERIGKGGAGAVTIITGILGRADAPCGICHSHPHICVTGNAGCGCRGYLMAKMPPIWRWPGYHPACSLSTAAAYPAGAICASTPAPRSVLVFSWFLCANRRVPAMRA